MVMEQLELQLGAGEIRVTFKMTDPDGYIAPLPTQQLHSTLHMATPHDHE